MDDRERDPVGSPRIQSGRMSEDQYSYKDRRPHDPFFYPTTVNPSTAYSGDTLQMVTPERKPADTFLTPLRQGRDNAGPPQAVNEPIPNPLFANPPILNYLEQPEDMKILQQQNDSLARQVQALEHAKSLAAVQSAQAMQKIRSRQELMRKEAQQVIQRAKEMQEQFSLSSQDLLSDLQRTGQPLPTLLPNLSMTSCADGLETLRPAGSGGSIN